jgi:hypothetical protein
MPPYRIKLHSLDMAIHEPGSQPFTLFLLIGIGSDKPNQLRLLELSMPKVRNAWGMSASRGSVFHWPKDSLVENSSFMKLGLAEVSRLAEGRQHEVGILAENCAIKVNLLDKCCSPEEGLWAKYRPTEVGVPMESRAVKVNLLDKCCSPKESLLAEYRPAEVGNWEGKFTKVKQVLGTMMYGTTCQNLVNFSIKLILWLVRIA